MPAGTVQYLHTKFMKYKFPILLLVLAPSSLLAADPAADTKSDTVVEEIIARIDNHIVTRSEYVRSLEQVKQEAQQQNAPSQDAAARQKDALRDLIDQELLVDEGQQLGITADTELVKRLDEIRKQMNLGTIEELEKAAQAQGVSYEEFKQNLRNNIITQQVIQREVGSHITISQEEIKKFYDEHKSEMQRPEQVRVSEILVSTDAKPAKKGPQEGNAAPEISPEQRVSEAESKANQLLAEIQKGAKFEDVSKKNSDGPTAAQGGDLGFFKRGVLAKDLEDLTFGMKPGEVSKPVRTKQGFVILKVTEHQMAGLPPMKDAEPKIQDALYYQKLQPALRSYLTKLREEAFIDIKQGYVDTGASPNQTKPVFTSAAVAGAKKLKKKKKFLLF
jgi:peptidyl-prolyl cis-trans isomerase SurA